MIRWEDYPKCQASAWVHNEKGNIDPVHQHLDDSWWWYDETWASECGPFPNREDAETSGKVYAKEVLGF